MRNAEKDREIISNTKRNPLIDFYLEMTSHYLERAVAAEQRVAELEKIVQTVKNELTIWNDAENARAVVLEYLEEALKGAESND